MENSTENTISNTYISNIELSIENNLIELENMISDTLNEGDN